MNKREASFQTKFNRWLRYEYKYTAAFELKSATTGSLPFHAVRPHQKDALLAVKHAALVYKIPDDSVGFKPFDCFSLKQQRAYVVVSYPEGSFYLVDIDKWCSEERVSSRRSLTEQRAKEIAEVVGAFPTGRARARSLSSVAS